MCLDGNPAGVVEKLGKGIEGLGSGMEKIHFISHGWLQPHKAKQMMRAAEVKVDMAVNLFESRGVELDKTAKQSIMFSALREVSGFENILDVISKVKGLDNQTSEIEYEWQSAFFDAAEKAFGERKQELLADLMSEKSKIRILSRLKFS